MKRLKILLNLGHGLPDYRQDQVVEETDEVAARLIAMRVAIELPPEAPRAERLKAAPASEPKSESVIVLDKIEATESLGAAKPPARKRSKAE